MSVLLVSRNRKNYLQECLNSLYNQTYKNKEIILVDDGSTEDLSDLSVDVYHYQSPQGISKARNEAMKLAKGKYYLVMDSDDLLEPTCLEEEVSLIEQGYDGVFSELEFINEKSERSGEYFGVQEQDLQELLQCKKIPHPGLMLRADKLAVIWYDTSLESAVDLDFTVRLLLKGLKLKKLDKPLVLYRKHGEQESCKQRQFKSVEKIRRRYDCFC